MNKDKMKKKSFKEFMSMLWGDVTQTPEEALHEKEVEERKNHLKPCPLCGCSKPIIQEEDIEHYYRLYRVVCPKCAITPSRKSYTIMDAMDAWDNLGGVREDD